MPPYSQHEWQRLAELSQRRSDRRRLDDARRSPHPWPERGHRLAALAVAVALVALGYGVLILACLLAGAVPPT